jgi:hypothetical protein
MTFPVENNPEDINVSHLELLTLYKYVMGKQKQNNALLLKTHLNIA